MTHSGRVASPAAASQLEFTAYTAAVYCVRLAVGIGAGIDALQAVSCPGLAVYMLICHTGCTNNNLYSKLASLCSLSHVSILRQEEVVVADFLVIQPDPETPGIA